MMHQDSGNTGSTDISGPSGRNVSLSTFAAHFAPILFDKDGGITGGAVTDSPNTTYTLNAIDPETLQVLSSWTAPADQTLNFAYMQQTERNNQILISSTEGFLFLVQRNNSAAPPVFTTLRAINVKSYLQPGEILLSSMFDSLSNIWFTTGTILGIPGSPLQNSTTLGYVSESGSISTLHIPGQAVENGIAISNETVYVVTGPPGDINQESIGYMYSFKADCNSSRVDTIWSATYDAGSARKPGGFARGSGTTPTLLGSKYVAITDNSDPVNALIYYQEPQNYSQLLCKVPIFTPGASAVDIGGIGHASEDGYSVFFLNDYNATSVYPSAAAPESDINGVFNNLTQMAPGGVRVDIPIDGNSCNVKWEQDIIMTSVPILSTKTALLYGYEQDKELANEGEYVWYMTARDWGTGEIIWRVRTGTGGSFNDDYEGNAIGKHGRLYQGVVGGVVVIEDGDMGELF
jgi:hypothetical protein